MPKEGDYTHTALLVDSGLYAVVRHPQYVPFMLLSLFLILVVQHWLIVAIGIAAMASLYLGIVPQADQANVDKFGDGYRRYMHRVPRMHVVPGVIRLLRQAKVDDKRR